MKKLLKRGINATRRFLSRKSTQVSIYLSLGIISFIVGTPLHGAGWFIIAGIEMARLNGKKVQMA